jgi:chemotaxis regulatin CheY-phosphate phosphatase CheZ
MSIDYYDKLEEVDMKLEELVSLKDSMYARLVAERNAAVAEVIKDFKNKVKFLQQRFDQSAERALSQLGETIPEEIKRNIKENNDDRK